MYNNGVDAAQVSTPLHLLHPTTIKYPRPMAVNFGN